MQTVAGETAADGTPQDVGCRFAHRCPLAEDICRRVEPILLDVAPLHAIACHVRTREAGITAVGGTADAPTDPTTDPT